MTITLTDTPKEDKDIQRCYRSITQPQADTEIQTEKPIDRETETHDTQKHIDTEGQTILIHTEAHRHCHQQNREYNILRSTGLPLRMFYVDMLCDILLVGQCILLVKFRYFQTILRLPWVSFCGCLWLSVCLCVCVCDSEWVPVSLCKCLWVCVCGFVCES